MEKIRESESSSGRKSDSNIRHEFSSGNIADWDLSRIESGLEYEIGMRDLSSGTRLSSTRVRVDSILKINDSLQHSPRLEFGLESRLDSFLNEYESIRISKELILALIDN
ncbi:hypothetical protein KPH14_002577 [Odynerus spinipes]|uniref:Uncharacterized protein n=1 Tax=Odynerus spinipes TaxID=1348599 RepID=A0AAD9VHV0_9HYME|nr:hypothetical protein KPH14_002577 [Odynerus spinipes]